MKAINKEELREFIISDKNLEYFGFSNLQLMESVGKEIAQNILTDFKKENKIAVFCGPGNNGGDGLVVARYLQDTKDITVFMIMPSGELTNETSQNLYLLENSDIKINYIQNQQDFPKVFRFDLAIDALFGTGLIPPLKEPYNSAVKHINSISKIASIDTKTLGVKPDIVYSIEVPKVDNAKIIKFGVPEIYFSYVGPANVQYLKTSKQASVKGENGQVAMVVGSTLHHGAAIFASKAASRFSDLVFALTPKSNLDYLKKHTSQAIVSEISKETIETFISRSQSLLIGPGLDTTEKEKKLVNDLVKKYSNKNIILDASALRVINKKNLHKNCLLTPHKDEFKSLFGWPADEYKVKEAAKKYNCTILLKSPVDLITNGNKLYRNFTGNPGLTVGGTGDILAGVLVAFASRNNLLDSARAGAFVVGSAGDYLYDEIGANFNAMDVIHALPQSKKWCEEF